MSMPHHPAYCTLQARLLQLQQDFQANNGSLPTLQQDFLQAQQQLQHDLMACNLEAWDDAIANKIQALQTEIHKQFRLLSMDVLFLKTARQVETLQARKQQINERVDRLLRYCQMGLEIEV